MIGCFLLRSKVKKWVGPIYAFMVNIRKIKIFLNVEQFFMKQLLQQQLKFIAAQKILFYHV